MRVALTGATGFVGSHAVQPLIQAGHRVRALVRPGRETGWLEGLGIEVCRGALGDEAALRALVADAVVHMAYDSAVWDTQDQLLHLRSNVLGSLMLLETARQAGVRQFICTVSTYILRRDVEGPGDVRETPLDEASPWAVPWMPYVTHNVVLGSACQAYHAQFGRGPRGSGARGSTACIRRRRRACGAPCWRTCERGRSATARSGATRWPCRTWLRR